MRLTIKTLREIKKVTCDLGPKFVKLIVLINDVIDNCLPVNEADNWK
jgi:hypothetical protein